MVGFVVAGEGLRHQFNVAVDSELNVIKTGPVGMPLDTDAS